MSEEKTKELEGAQNEKEPPEKPESCIIDLTDEFLGLSLIFTGAKKQ